MRFPAIFSQSVCGLVCYRAERLGDLKSADSVQRKAKHLVQNSFVHRTLITLIMIYVEYLAPDGRNESNRIRRSTLTDSTFDYPNWYLSLKFIRKSHLKHYIYTLADMFHDVPRYRTILIKVLAYYQSLDFLQASALFLFCKFCTHGSWLQ